MTAVAVQPGRMSFVEKWRYHNFTLASGYIAYKNATCVLVLGTGKVRPGTAAPGRLVLGKFDEYVDASAADKVVRVYLEREIEVDFYANQDSIASTDLGALCYVYDDQTVAKAASGSVIAGRIWAVDSVKGVAVERLDIVRAPLEEQAAIAFTSNDCVIADYPMHGSIFDVPTTAAASTVTLPAAAIEGTEITFVADGTKNGHTVQYRDATGPVNLTTALTASKRHTCKAQFLNSKWNALAYISP